jgi:spore germination protein KA
LRIFFKFVDKDSLNKDILKSLMYEPEHLRGKEKSLSQLIDLILTEALYHSEAKVGDRIDQLIELMLRGETLIFIDGLKEAIHRYTKG